MNGRIQQLTAEAREYATTRHPASYITLLIDADKFEQKFAELMIEEFQTILRNNSGEDTGTLSYRVEDHFRS
jgi:hypothetical protein